MEQKSMRVDDHPYDGYLIESNSESQNEEATNDVGHSSEPGVRRSMRRVRSVVEKTLRSTNDSGQTRNIVRDALLNVLNGQIKTARSKGVQTMSGISETKLPSDSSSSKVESEIIPFTESGELLTSIDQANLQAMSLLTSSAKHLHVLMKSVVGPLEGENANPHRLTEVERVNAAANCGKQISSLMRLQLDAIKLIRGEKRT